MKKKEKTYQYGMTKKQLQEVFKGIIPIINKIRNMKETDKKQKEKKAA